MVGEVTGPPSAEASEELARIAKLVAQQQQVRLVVGTDEQVALPTEAAAVVRRALEVLAEGKAVALATYEQELSTQQAADLLGMSRQHLVDLLDAGEIAHHRVGAHRRVRLEDVLAFAERRRQHRVDTLGELARQSQESDPAGYH